MPYAIRGKRFLLTFPAAQNYDGLSKDTIADHFEYIGAEWIEVCAETHQDESPHFHAVCEFGVTFNGDGDAFAVNGCTPNITSVSRGSDNVFKVRQYIRKQDADLTVRGDPIPFDATYVPKGQRYTWKRILAVASSQQEFLGLVREHFAQEWVLRHHDILAFASQEYNSPSNYVPEWPRDAYTVPVAADDWVQECITNVSYDLAPRDRDTFYLLIIKAYVCLVQRAATHAYGRRANPNRQNRMGKIPRTTHLYVWNVQPVRVGRPGDLPRA